MGERGREWLTPLLPSLSLGGVDALLPSVRVLGGAGLAVLVPSLFPVYCPETRALLSVRHFLDVRIPLQVSGKETKLRADLGLILR